MEMDKNLRPAFDATQVGDPVAVRTRWTAANPGGTTGRPYKIVPTFGQRLEVRMRIGASRSSPVVVDCTVFCRVVGGKSSLHLGLVYFRQAESQVVEQDLLMLSRC